MRQKLISFLLMLCAVVPAFGQSKAKVSGVVTDETGEPLPGVVVVVEGTKDAAMTDMSGKYTINCLPSASLKFSFLGYADETVQVGKRAVVNVQMRVDASQIDEAVVIGYGSVRKADLTGSVTNVKMADIKNVPVTSVDQALQGRIAGADIMSTTGEPGATTSIRIRGTRSISASNEPLIVVDGVMDAIHDLNDLNSADIESITVLKDASSTAIYGSRGSNGVIIITTKSGGSDSATKPNITFKADAGFSQLPRRLDIMNATEFALYRNDYAQFASSDNMGEIGTTTPISESIYKDPFSLGKGTDWIEEITRTAPYQNYNLSFSGANKKTRYYASVGYNNTQGIIKKSGMERIQTAFNIDHQFFKWLKLGYNVRYTYRHNDENLTQIGGTGWYNSAQYLSPLMKPQDIINPLYYSGQRINTPTALLNNNTHYVNRHTLNQVANVEITPIPTLKIRSQFSYYLYERNTNRYYPSTLPIKTEGEGGDAYRSDAEDYSLSSETTVTYDRDFLGGHHLDAMAGFTAYKSASKTFSLSGSGYMVDDNLWNNMNAVIDKETYSASSSYSEISKMSVLARINYNYKQRYYITLTGRADGASNFAANRKWGFFPSGALKWNISNEPWMKNANVVDDLSLRFSAGRTGNDAIGAYRSLAAMSTTTSGYLFGGSQPVAYYPSRLASPNLTWEKTDLYNIALDAGFFGNRLTFTFEAYLAKTTDLLLTVQTATQSGYSSRFANIGSTTNKGLELSIEGKPIVKKNFSWTASFTISHNTQMVNDIGTEDFVVAYSSPGNNPYMMYGYVKGYPLNALWGFVYGGVWHNQDEIDRNQYTKTYASSSVSLAKTLGAPKYVDVNHDGNLNQQDLCYLGNADPVIYGGLQNTFRYKGLSLGFYFMYSLGGKIYNFSEFYMAGSTFTNQYRYMLDSWHPTRNPESNLPRAGVEGPLLPSSLLVHDASFLRLKNITLSYTFNFKKEFFLKDLTISASGENIYLWKYYNGFDPDVSTNSDSSTIRRMDLGAYPKPRTFMFSLQVRY
ncbi:MAG: TonB-dependent receptor [Bacteroidales bacterium]|nr:TonB-dependent receptor [Bacteroidales bacterium]